MNNPHLVFTGTANGILKVLITPITLIDNLKNSSIKLNRAIWDTGATNSVINITLAQKLGLVATGMTECHTANGKNFAGTYLVDLILLNNLRIAELVISDGKLGPDVDMLIGMDVIGHGDFIVQNNNGKTEFSFCYPPFQTKYNMQQKAESLNAKIKKKYQNNKLLAQKAKNASVNPKPRHKK